MVGIELWQREACIEAVVALQCIRIGLACYLERLSHRNASHTGQTRYIREHIRNREIIFPLIDFHELHDLVELAFLVLLRLRMHIRRADSHARRTAIADLFAFLIELLAEGLCQELYIPLGDGFQVVSIRHHDLYITSVLLGCRELQCGIEHGRVLPEVILLALLVHILSAFEEALYIKADACRKRQPDLAEDRETSADTVRYAVLRPAVLYGELLQYRWILLIRICDCDDFNIDIRLILQCVIDDHEV